MKEAFSQWRLELRCRQADHWYEHRLMEKVISHWRHLVVENQEDQEAEAEMYHERMLWLVNVLI